MRKRMQMILLLSAGLPAVVLADGEAAYAETDPAQEVQTQEAPAQELPGVEAQTVVVESSPPADAAPAAASDGSLLARLRQSWQPAEDHRPLPGADTDAWLSLQTGGAAASTNPQPVSMAYRERAAARFMKTLDQEIPVVKSDSGFKSDK